MAEQILGEYKNRVASFELIPSSGGVFEVTVDEKLVFSKKSLGRFPEADEVESKIRELAGLAPPG